MSSDARPTAAGFPRLAAELQQHEQLLWAGRPDARVIVSRADIFLVPFSLLFLGFSIFWTIEALSGGAPWFFGIFGVFFIVMGAFLTVGRFVVKISRKRRTEYAVTDERAILVAGRTVRQAKRGSDYQTTRSRNGSHVTVEWNDQGGSGFGFGAARRQPLNSGLDGTFGPLPMAFVDVADAEPLIAALRRLDG